MTGFDGFWPLYLRAHRNRRTRAAHYAGILFGTAMTVAAIAAWSVWPLLAGIGGAFAVTVSSHFLFEGRRPLLVGNPLLAAAADLRMLWLAAAGRLLPEFARHGIETEGSRSGIRWRPVCRAASGVMLAAAMLTLELLL